jgi:plastocyanin
MLLIVALILSACNGAQPDGPPTVTASSPDAAATPTVQAIPTVQPTSTIAQATTTPQTNAASAASGALVWRDQILRNDAVVVSISGLAEPPTGEAYIVWLANNERSLPLGALRFQGNGLATLTYTAPDQQNLLGNYSQVYVSQSSQADAAPSAASIVMSGALPEEALIHIRHVLFSIPVTPGETGFALGLRQETDEILRHAQFLKEAFDTNNFALEQVHAEHIINIIRGTEARDVNGDGKVQNPGDGFGLLPNGQQDGYIKGMIDHAKLAAAALDATDAIQLHSSHVQIAGENTRERIEQVRLLAEKIAAASSQADTQQDVLSILALTEQAIQGIDIDLDEQIAPIPGEGGVVTAYQHAQLMAAVPLTPSTGAENIPAPETAATDTQEIVIDIGDNSFSPGKITIPVGAMVVWRHTGQRPHTVTEDGGSFDSGTLDAGATFSVTFDTAGTFAYHCAFHGGPGGEGMAGAIIVSAGSAAAEAPVPPPTPAGPVPTALSTPAPPAQTPTTPPTPAPPTATLAPTAEPPASDVTVSIGDNSFDAPEITIPVGATVVWRHTGQRPHTVTADDGSFDSGTLNTGATFSHTFMQPGVYRYYCAFHGGANGEGMAGIIIVGDAGQAPVEPGQATVSMQDFEFGPQEIRIKAGTTVTWRNDGAKKHSATTVEAFFDTGLFEPGQTRRVTFDQPGVYAYYCQLHGEPSGTSGMVGTVIVEN